MIIATSAACPSCEANRRLLTFDTLKHGWRSTLAASGANLDNVTRHRPKQLDRESMIQWLRNRKASGQTLVYTEVCLENRDYVLAIKREFKSWVKAIEEAFPPLESSAE